MKGKRLIKLLSKPIALILMALILVGCASNGETGTTTTPENTPSGGGTQSGTETTETPDTSSIEGATISIAVRENIRVEDFNTNLMKLEIEDALGVSLDFMVLPSADYETKINLMVAGGETLPDMIFSPARDNVNFWAQEGVLLPLNRFYDDHSMSYNIHAASEYEGVDIPTFMTSPDGNIYGIPSFTPSPNGEVWRKLWVYEPWLEQLGEEVPQTTDEYLNIVRRIAETDMNDNGRNDEIGLTGTGIGTFNDAWFKFLMSSFIYAYDDEFRVLDNGVISFAYDTELWRDGLRYIKTFFDEGLIPIETLTQDDDGLRAMKNADDNLVFSFVYFNADLFTADRMDRRLGYNFVSALRGPNGLKEAMFAPSLPGIGAVITVDSENPEAAFAVGNYMCTPNIGLSQRFGLQGQDWDHFHEANINHSDFAAVNPAMEPNLMVYDDVNFWSAGIIQNRSFALTGPAWKPKDTVGGQAVNIASTDPDEVQLRMYQQIYAASSAAGLTIARKDVVSYLPLLSEESNQINDIRATLSSYLQENIAAFLVGNLSIDSDWDNYIAELEAIGYKTVLEVYQTAYDRLYG